MFERFTADARQVVVGAQTTARESGARSIDGRSLLLGLTETAGPATDALTSVGLDPSVLARDLRAQLASGGLDAEALASVGIDLAAVRASADAVFGKEKLDAKVATETLHILLKYRTDIAKATKELATNGASTTAK